MRSLILLMMLAAGTWCATTRSADAYFRDAAYEYIAGRMPTATQTCEEGLRQYPNDARLKNLLERIRENKEEQKNKCDNPQDGGDPDDQKKNDNKDGEKDDKKNDKKDGQKDEQKKDSEGQSSDSRSGNSSSSAGKQEPQSPEGQQGASSAGGASSATAAPQPMRPGELSKDQAEQLLRDFNQNTGERKPWKPVQGRKIPEKDW